MALEIKTNFEEDLKEMILNGLNINLENSLFEELNSKKIRDLMIIDSNYRKRVPISIPPEVIISKELLESPEYIKFESVIEKIKNIFEQGQEIKPYSSRGIVNIYTLNNDKDKDLLLNDWGIHHLHLGDILESDGFIKRTPEVLFCKITEDKVYMILILEHGNGKLPWVEKKILKVIKDNWSELLEHCKLNGILGFAHECTENEHYILRKNHVNAGIKIDDEYYVSPNCGISCSGHSTMDIISCDRTLKLLELIEDILNQSQERISNIIDERTGKSIEKAIFNLERFVQGEIVLVEENTKLIIKFVLNGSNVEYMDLMLGKPLVRVFFKPKDFE